MTLELPKTYTPEEISGIEKTRTLSDADFLRSGAEYNVNEKGEKINLIVSERQKKDVEGFPVHGEEVLHNEKILLTLQSLGLDVAGEFDLGYDEEDAVVVKLKFKDINSVKRAFAVSSFENRQSLLPAFSANKDGSMEIVIKVESLGNDNMRCYLPDFPGKEQGETVIIDFSNIESVE